MKVLWFVNTPSLGASYLKATTIGGGWIESLEAKITQIPDLRLGIVFKWAEAQVSPFTIEKTKYYPVYKPLPKGKLSKIVHRWKHKTAYEENIPIYLDIIEEFKPDVIHIFGTEDDFGLVIPKLSIPCIIHIQGNLTVYSHKWYSGMSSIDVLRHSKLSMLLKGNGLLHEYQVYKKEAERERKIFQGCHFFAGRTDWDRRIALSLAPAATYFHCEEMLRKEFYVNQWTSPSATDYSIVTTIRKNIYKGLETILECKKILQKSFPQLQIQWKVAGIKNGDELVSLAESKYKEKFENNNILLLGRLDVNQLITEMLSANLFIHPSHIDNSPNSLCEAMILGMPVISTYAGGIPSLLDDRKEGILVQDGDPYALCGAIIELIRDKDYAATLGKNARTRAIARHNDQGIVDSLLNIYIRMGELSANLPLPVYDNN
jgi:glycosyltransferase involved in cell wall biosynthesis